MKRFILLMLLGCFGLCIYAQNSEYVVRSFASNMQSWGQTSELEYQLNLQDLCNGVKSIRVSDEIVESLAAKNGYTADVKGAYFLETYLNCLRKEIKNGINIQYSDFRKVRSDETTISNTRGYEMIACNIVISGAVNYNVKDLFYVRDGKISKIDKYKEIVDRTTGRRKIKVDFSGIDFDDYAFAATYNYSKSFPVGISVEYAWPWFRLGLDFGINFKKDEYIYDDMNMTDIMNYERSKKILDPKFYVAITPSLYLKYFSIGCGVGTLYMYGTEENSHSSYAESGSGAYNTTSKNCEALKFMIRPVVKGFVPINEDISVVVSVGYDYFFGLKEKNGFNFGAGLQFALD